MKALTLPPLPASKVARCPHNDLHPLVVRPVTEKRFVIYGDSCDMILCDRLSRSPIFHGEGISGYRWSVGFQAERICNWRPGERMVLFDPRVDDRWETPWRLPRETTAVAVGIQHIALLVGNQTRLMNFGGLVSGGRLPRWDEGVFKDDLLLITRQRPLPEERGPLRSGRQLWVVEPGSWTVLWSLFEYEGLWIVH